MINSAHKFETVGYITFGLMCDVRSKKKNLVLYHVQYDHTAKSLINHF